MLERIDYTVMRLDGDYAYLQAEGVPETEWKCVARALLPEAVTEGSHLVYEMLSYHME